MTKFCSEEEEGAFIYGASQPLCLILIIHPIIITETGCFEMGHKNWWIPWGARGRHTRGRHQWCGSGYLVWSGSGYWTSGVGFRNACIIIRIWKSKSPNPDPKFYHRTAVSIFVFIIIIILNDEIKKNTVPLFSRGRMWICTPVLHPGFTNWICNPDLYPDS